MSLNIIVCAKQVMDPETPLSAFNVDEAAKRVVPAQGIPPVVNGFCENAVEAALKIKEAAGDATITVISVGTDFVMDVMKKPLSMGADQMILIQDPAAENLDALGTATVLSKAIEKIGEADIVICGQQASDWDNAHVPLGVSEMLGVACLSEAKGASNTSYPSEREQSRLLVHVQTDMRCLRPLCPVLSLSIMK